jgi:hypothetical protein
MKSKNYLTKSLFSLSNSLSGCHRKLHYELNQYPKQEEASEILQFYNDNGKAVGILARGYFPQGQLIEEKDPELAYQQTLNVLQEEDEVILFEPAFIYKECYIRADILIKKQHEIKLIEVKSKSIRESINDIDKQERQRILMDLAFQTWVIKGALGVTYTIEPTFFLVNKDYQQPVSYRETFDFKDSIITLKQPLSNEMINKPILKEINAKVEVNKIIQEGLENEVNLLVESISTNMALDPLYLGNKCKTCEFKVALDAEKNGFKECWKISRYAGFDEPQFQLPSLFEVGNKLIVNSLTHQKKYTLEEALPILEVSSSEFNDASRRYIQAKKLLLGDPSIVILKEVVKENIKQLQYPLYFLDFEAAPFTLPIFPNYRPNQKVIFQYSIHKIELLNGEEVISHHRQFIDLGREDPTIHLIRSLFVDLGSKGSVFMYSPYENTCLNDIEVYLNNHPDFSDKNELITFIHSLTYRNSNQYGLTKRSKGNRALIDLCEWVKSSYLDPETKGSYSIKKILPSMINHSTYLQTMYSQKDIYGKKSKIKSLNFETKQWLMKNEAGFEDPYHLLSNPLPVEEQFNETELEDNPIEINNGGLALIAYAKIQHRQLNPIEIERYQEALLKYCELDTLAMVMVFQGLVNL